jgi:hypothetical protein
MNAIDLAVLKKPNKSLAELIKAVQKENIHVVLRQNDNGIIYGITYVDHHTKCVFNGSHLGKQYSANGIQQRCNAGQLINQPSNEIKESFNPENLEQQKVKDAQSNSQENSDTSQFAKSAAKLFDELIQPEENRNTDEPFQQKKFRRKRKRKQQHSHN